MDRIYLNQMHFYAYHGAYPEENKLGQRFYVDLELLVDIRKASLSDDLNYTIHYGEVYEVVKDEVENQRRNLIETIAEQIATRVLQDFPVQEVMVRVTKPDPPIPGHLQSVAVEITRGTQS